MRSIFKNKRRILGLGVTLAITAAVAVAYWSSTGSGTGSGSVGSHENVQLSGTIDDVMMPGHTSAVTLTATRDSETTYRIGAITGTVDASGTCPDDKFTFTGPTAEQTVAAGSGQQTLTAGSISMANDSPDSCKNATLSLALSAAQGANGS
jgi:hypothetical protein